MRRIVTTGLNRGRISAAFFFLMTGSIVMMAFKLSQVHSEISRALYVYGLLSGIPVILSLFGLVEYIILTSDEIVLYSIFIPVLRMKINSSVYVNVTYFTKKEPQYLLLSNVPIEDEHDCEAKRVNVGPFNAFVQLLIGKKTCNSMQLIYDKKYEAAIREFYQIRD